MGMEAHGLITVTEGNGGYRVGSFIKDEMAGPLLKIEESLSLDDVADRLKPFVGNPKVTIKIKLQDARFVEQLRSHLGDVA